LIWQIQEFFYEEIIAIEILEVVAQLWFVQPTWIISDWIMGELGEKKPSTLTWRALDFKTLISL
jgi:hypothetical protein